MMISQKQVRWLLVTSVCVGLLLFIAGCPKSSNDSNNPTDPQQSSSDPIAADPEGWTLAIDDSLKNTSIPGRTLGGEGWFADQGYFIDGDWNSFILYDTDIVRDIRLEFDAIGYQAGEPMKGDDDQMALFLLQDAPPGTLWPLVWQWQRSSLFQFYKMADFDITDGYKGKAGAAYYDCDHEWKTSWGDFGRDSWESDRTYHWTLIIDDGYIEIKRDDNVLLVKDTCFRPEAGYRVYIGGADWNVASPNHVTYSNVKIYRK